MDNRYNAYGIGQRRQPNDASSFAPIRSSGGGGGSGSGSGNGGGGLDDNFRRPQSMNYGRSDSFNNGNGYNNQRYSEIENNKFGNMQANNFGSGGGGGGGSFSSYSNNSNNNQRFGNSNNNGRGADVSLMKSSFDDNFRGPSQQQQQNQSSFLGRTFEQRYNAGGDSSGSLGNSTFLSGSNNYRSLQGQLNQQQQQQQPQSQMPSGLSLARSLSDIQSNIDKNQRFYNNDRSMDTFRRNDNFGGQESNGANFKFDNDRAAPSFGRASNNAGNFGNFNDGGFNDDFRRPQSNAGNVNSSNQQSFYNNHNNNISNSNNNSNQSNMGSRNSGPNYRGPDDSMAMVANGQRVDWKNQSSWQVGNSYGSALGKRNNKWNFEVNSGPKPNQALSGSRPPFPNQQQLRAPRQANLQNNQSNYNNTNNYNNKPQQQQPNAARNKFPGNKAPQQQQQQQHQQQQQKQKPQQQRPIVKNSSNAKNPQAAPKNATVNGGKPKPVQAATAATAAPKVQNTQAKNNPSNNKQQQPATKTNNKAVAQKRAAEPAPAPLTRADIKRRKLAMKRGFLLGGFKLPYINNQKVALPQPEDKSYAIMFFEQSPNYSTSGEELDDEAVVDIPEPDQDVKNAGRTLVKRIRKRLHYEWAIREEAKKYTTWPTWWTDYKWCEEAIKEQLDTFGSINLRNCFIPDLPRLTTEQVVDVIVSQAQFALEKNSDNYFNNMKSIFTLMNVTFLENLKMPNTEKVQDMIRSVPNNFWTYKMRSMVYLWAQYQKISKTSSPDTETGVKELQAIARDWKNPLFHWIAKQAFDELKAISEVEWPEHKQQYATLESSAPAPAPPPAPAAS